MCRCTTDKFAFLDTSRLTAHASVIVIGGGLAGLATAAALGKAGFQVDLFEARGFSGRPRHFLSRSARKKPPKSSTIASTSCCAAAST